MLLFTSLMVLVPLGALAVAAVMSNRAVDGEKSDFIDDWYLSGRTGTPVLPRESETPVGSDLSTAI